MAYTAPGFIAKTPEQKTQVRIFNTLRVLNELPKTIVSREFDEFQITAIYVENENEFMPNFKLVYDSRKHYYRVYILVASGSRMKEIAGYCICTVRTGVIAAGFATLYKFLHANRANNKTGTQ